MKLHQTWCCIISTEKQIQTWHFFKHAACLESNSGENLLETVGGSRGSKEPLSLAVVRSVQGVGEVSTVCPQITPQGVGPLLHSSWMAEGQKTKAKPNNNKNKKIKFNTLFWIKRLSSFMQTFLTKFMLCWKLKELQLFWLNIKTCKLVILQYL